MHGDLTNACALQRTFCRRDRLGLELARLERLQQLAMLWPYQWRRATAACRESLALWLYGVALGVAGLGLHDAAVALLDSLPGIDGGAGGRRDLLRALLADAATSPAGPSPAGANRNAANDTPQSAERASLPCPSQLAAGGGR